MQSRTNETVGKVGQPCIVDELHGVLAVVLRHHEVRVPEVHLERFPVSIDVSFTDTPEGEAVRFELGGEILAEQCDRTKAPTSGGDIELCLEYVRIELGRAYKYIIEMATGDNKRWQMARWAEDVDAGSLESDSNEYLVRKG